MLGLTDEQIKNIRDRNNGKIPVDAVMNIWSDARLWANIPGFNGYQLSDDYIVRSFKFKRIYPYGTIVTPKKEYKDKPLDNVYELSDNDNMRIEITAFELGKLVHSQLQSPMNLYHTATIMPVTETVRNKRMCINQDPVLTAQKKGLVKKSVPVNKKETTAMARFTITNNPKPLLDEGEDI